MKLFDTIFDPSRWRFAPEQAQLEYYRKTARTYEESHQDEKEHEDGLIYLEAFVEQLGASSILDSGCGTGKVISRLHRRFPAARIFGNDPSPDLLQIAIDRGDVPKDNLHCCGTLDLPFPEFSFDVVTSFAVLHHVANPTEIVRRMIGLCKKAVFISDCNYMAQGSALARLAKLGLTLSGTWPILKFVQQGFRGWHYSDGDGVAYSYSVFSDLALLQKHFERVVVIPVGLGSKSAVAWPMLRAPTVLIGGINRLDSGPA